LARQGTTLLQKDAWVGPENAKNREKILTDARERAKKKGYVVFIKVKDGSHITTVATIDGRYWLYPIALYPGFDVEGRQLRPPDSADFDVPDAPFRRAEET